MTHFDSLLLGVDILLVPLAVIAYVVLTGDTVRKFIALQTAGALMTVMLALLSVVFASAQFIELAIAAGLLSIGGSFAYAHFLERWL